MKKEICFDMDGTIADLYGVEGWLDDITAQNERPYLVARPMVNMTELTSELTRLQAEGYTIKIISWLARNSTTEYDEKVTCAKKKWLATYFEGFTFDEVHIVKYGTPKYTLGEGILFDDEKTNRKTWNGRAYNVYNIIGTLKGIS